MKNVFLICSMALGLGACGAKHSLDPGISESNVEAIDRYEIKALAPANPGGMWSREIKVFSESLSDWPIEKRASKTEPWIGIGFTNDRGEFVDNLVAEDAEYRIGKIHSTGIQTGLFDYLLRDNLSGDLSIKARRVIVEKNVVVFMGSNTLQIESDILEIHGQIKAFAENTPTSQNGGLLVVRANIVMGAGAIILNGAQGAPGSQGAQGPNGYMPERWQNGPGGPGGTGLPGGVGNRGGRGGNITISAKKMNLFTIESKGGLGGVGGAGGEGGWGGLGAGIRGGQENPQGAKGATGPQGAGGQRGEDGNIAVTIVDDLKIL